MPSFIDLTGQTFGKLTVIERVPNVKRGVTRWQCSCSCGKETITTSAALRSGNCRSCGCLHVEAAREQGLKAIRHGGTGSRLYRVWSNMKTRCYNKSNKNFERWGKRGIALCDEWRESFESFREWAIESGYSDNLSIDRIDNSKGYCPENCRWATPREQANNTRKTRFISYKGKTLSLHGWSRELKIPVCTLFYRLKNHSVETAFAMPYKAKLADRVKHG